MSDGMTINIEVLRKKRDLKKKVDELAAQVSALEEILQCKHDIRISDGLYQRTYHCTKCGYSVSE
ncbi:MAG TPA: hypothetical protein VFM18_21545 [Methanosarcina sp.]|nr:hypothetical protein [Methanosarcina sp.]